MENLNIEKCLPFLFVKDSYKDELAELVTMIIERSNAESISLDYYTERWLANINNDDSFIKTFAHCYCGLLIDGMHSIFSSFEPKTFIISNFDYDLIHVFCSVVINNETYYIDSHGIFTNRNDIIHQYGDDLIASEIDIEDLNENESYSNQVLELYEVIQSICNVEDAEYLGDTFDYVQEQLIYLLLKKCFER